MYIHVLHRLRMSMYFQFEEILTAAVYWYFYLFTARFKIVISVSREGIFFINVPFCNFSYIYADFFNASNIWEEIKDSLLRS